jgi:hypothetical protein
MSPGLVHLVARRSVLATTATRRPVATSAPRVVSFQGRILRPMFDAIHSAPSS